MTPDVVLHPPQILTFIRMTRWMKFSFLIEQWNISAFYFFEVPIILGGLFPKF